MSINKVIYTTVNLNIKKCFSTGKKTIKLLLVPNVQLCCAKQSMSFISTEWAPEIEKRKVCCRISNARVTLLGATILKFSFNASTPNLKAFFPSNVWTMFVISTTSQNLLNWGLEKIKDIREHVCCFPAINQSTSFQKKLFQQIIPAFSFKVFQLKQRNTIIIQYRR